MEASALRGRGWSVSAIARHLGRDRKTMRAYLRGERQPGVRRRAVADTARRAAAHARTWTPARTSPTSTAPERDHPKDGTTRRPERLLEYCRSRPRSSEQREVGRRRLDGAGRASMPASSSRPRKIGGAPGREVVAVVVEERVDLVGLARRAARIGATHSASSSAVYIQSKRSAALRPLTFQVGALRPWKRTRQTGWVAAAIRGITFEARVSGLSTDTYAEPVALEERERVGPLLRLHPRAVAELDQWHERARAGRARAPAPPSPRAT